MMVLGREISKKTVIAVSVVGAVVVIGAGVGGAYAYYRASQDDYNASIKAYDIAEKKFANILKTKDVLSARGIKPDEVADKTLVDTLNKDAKATFVKVEPDSWIGYSKAANINTTNADKYKTQSDKVRKDVVNVNTSKANKQLSDTIGVGDKTLSDSDGKVPDGDNSRNDLAKSLETSKGILKNKKSLLKNFVDAKSDLDAKVQAVNNSINAKSQADAKAAQDAADAAAAQAQAASAAVSGGSGYSGGSSYGGGSGYSGGSGYRAPSGGGSGYRAPSGGGYSAPSGGGSAPAPSNGGHPTWTGTTDGSNATGHWDGNHFIGEQEF